MLDHVGIEVSDFGGGENLGLKSLDNLRTLSQVFLGEQITSLAGKRMDEVCGALAIATGCR